MKKCPPLKNQKYSLSPLLGAGHTLGVGDTEKHGAGPVLRGLQPAWQLLVSLLPLLHPQGADLPVFIRVRVVGTRESRQGRRQGALSSPSPLCDRLLVFCTAWLPSFPSS